MVGLIAASGDQRFPDCMEFLQSSLRVEDGLFRMTRDRIVVHLADVDSEQGVAVRERLPALHAQVEIGRASGRARV